MSTRAALIVIGRYKEEWNTLTSSQKKDFVSRVGKAASAAGLFPIIGYRLASAPGSFLEVWEAPDTASVNHAVRDLEAMGYARYVDARWLIGERESEER